MTRTALQDVERIRALLAPERVAARPVPAAGLPCVRVVVEHQPGVRIPAAVHHDYLVDAHDAHRVAQNARADHAAAPPAQLRGMPTPAEREERTQRALDRLAGGNLVSGERAIVAARRLATGGGWR